jgi:hypothetical protein
MFNFIDNDCCPLCGNKLTLFFQTPKELFKTEKCKSFLKLTSLYDNYNDCYFSVKNSRFLKIDFGKTLNTDCFFLYLCKPDAVDLIRSRINLYNSCYYKRSPKFQINLDKTLSINDYKTAGEAFGFSITRENIQYIYCLNINYELNKTNFYYYNSLNNR